MINRDFYFHKITKLFEINPIVALLGPRQCGKTTLARQYFNDKADDPSRQINWFDLEDPTTLARLESPILALDDLTGLIVIDEIQRLPDLFPVLRVLADRNREKQRYLILGSASRELIKQSSESLAGRISYLELRELCYPEVNDIEKLWLRGGFPRSYLASDDELSWEWRKAYVSTFLEKDIPALGIQVPAKTLRRFWMMLAHYHGGIFNASAIGKSLGVAHTTARHYLDILTGTFMVRELMPWLANVNKRQVKSPKIYFRDSGIYHFLLNIADKDALKLNPNLGASWEGFAIEQVLSFLAVEQGEAYFWGIHNQCELDLFVVKQGKRLGFEVKYTDKPKLTDSMQMAVEMLELDELVVLYPGDRDFPLTEKVRVSGLANYLLSR